MARRSFGCLCLTSILVALALLAPSTPAFAVNAGQPAPAFALPDREGQTVTLEGLRGKVVLVDFWASWCAPCRRSFPWMNEIQQKYGAKGLTIVGVNVDKRRADADKFLTQFPAGFTIVFDPDGNTPTAYDAKGMPTSYLVDPKGGVVLVEVGFRDERKAELEAKIRSLLPR